MNSRGIAIVGHHFERIGILGGHTQPVLDVRPLHDPLPAGILSGSQDDCYSFALRDLRRAVLQFDQAHRVARRVFEQP